MRLKTYIDDLLSRGKHFFLTEDLKAELGLSEGAMWTSLARLKKKREIVSPARGYYVIVPLEYRALGTLPPEQFIHQLMQHQKIPYYVGLLSAAQRYGAAHQQPQVFQVIVPRHKRPIKVGRIEVTFIINKHLNDFTFKEFNTPRGIVRYASPETTAIELVMYSSHCGGLSHVLTVLSELIEELDVEAFKHLLIKVKELPTLQRLGYLLEAIHAEEFANAVNDRLKSRYLATVPLDVKNSTKEGEINKRWSLQINAQLEGDL